jgi:hypothetical protein
MDRLGAPWCTCGIGWQIADDRCLWSGTKSNLVGCTKNRLGWLALERVRSGWWRRRQRGGIEQNVSKRGNIEKVVPLLPIHIIR